MSLEQYWNNSGRYQEVANKLNELIPVEGSVENPRKNKALEKYRNASNCYYDLYNNGLCNRVSEFRKVFDIASSMYKQPWRGFGCYEPAMYIKVERAMDEIILAAAKEQNISTAYNGVTQNERMMLLAA